MNGVEFYTVMFLKFTSNLGKKTFSNIDKKILDFFFRSLLDLSDSKVDKNKLEQLVSSMYKAAGVREGSDMTFKDFKTIFANDEYAGTLEKATLNLDGKE